MFCLKIYTKSQIVLILSNNLASFVIISSHNHEPRIKQALRKIEIDKMRAIILSTDDSPCRIAYTIVIGTDEK